MRYFEISGGFRVPISSEEQQLLDEVKSAGRIEHDKLDERGQELARLMVSRGVLNRETVEETMTYTANQPDAWRY